MTALVGILVDLLEAAFSLTAVLLTLQMVQKVVQVVNATECQKVSQTDTDSQSGRHRQSDRKADRQEDRHSK